MSEAWKEENLKPGGVVHLELGVRGGNKPPGFRFSSFHASDMVTPQLRSTQRARMRFKTSSKWLRTSRKLSILTSFRARRGAKGIALLDELVMILLSVASGHKTSFQGLRRLEATYFHTILRSKPRLYGPVCLSCSRVKLPKRVS